MSRTQVQLLYNRFKEGREDLNDDVRLSRPSMSTTDENIEALKKTILDNRRITIRDVPDDVGILFGGSYPVICIAKTTSPGHRLDVDAVQRRYRFAQKAHNC